MAYKHRDEAPGIHHITCRGNNKRSIFEDDHDRRRFLLQLGRVARRYGWQLHAYCLLQNHYQLVIEIDERGMSKGFCELNTGYARSYNKRHGRLNHLFGKRYRSNRLKDQTGFLNSCRDVLQNPLRAGNAAAWRGSSYRATIGLTLSNLPRATTQLPRPFANQPAKAAAHFHDLVSTRTPTRRRRQPP